MSPEILIDKQAFSMLQRGIERGLKYYYKKYDTALIYFAQRITSSESAAEDLVSESFIKLWQNRETLLHHGAVKSYLYQIVRNGAIDFVRSKKRENIHLQNIVHLHPFSEEAVTSFEISAETHRLIYQAIENLPLRCGLVFRKFYIEGKTLPQIAAELHLSINTVRNQKAQALAILRKQFPAIIYILACMYPGR